MTMDATEAFWVAGWELREMMDQISWTVSGSVTQEIFDVDDI